MKSATRRAVAMSCVTTMNVALSWRFRSRISSLRNAVRTGSSPESGSSNMTISGSRTSARARPARFFIPPEISPGSFFSAPCRPTRPSFSSTICLISRSGLRVCSRSGNATLSKTFIEPNSAPSWNRTPNLRRTLYRSRAAELDDVLAVDPDLAALGLQQAHDVLEEHRFARARWAEHQRDLALGDVARDVVEDRLGPERLREAPDRDLDLDLAVAPMAVRGAVRRRLGGMRQHRGFRWQVFPPRPHPQWWLAGCGLACCFPVPERQKPSPPSPGGEPTGQDACGVEPRH